MVKENIADIEGLLKPHIFRLEACPCRKVDVSVVLEEH